MLYREAGQFRTSYAQDSQIFPLRQDRIGIAVILIAAVLLPFVANTYWLSAILILVFAKFLGVGVAAFIFDVTRPKLLQMAWFQRLYDWVMLVWISTQVCRSAASAVACCSRAALTDRRRSTLDISV